MTEHDPSAETATQAGHQHRSVVLPRIQWAGATSGEFNPADVFYRLFRRNPDHATLSKGLAKALGKPLSRDVRNAPWTDYVIDTAVENFFIEVRMKEPTRFFGYAMTPEMWSGLREEIRVEKETNGEWLEAHYMPHGTLNRRTYEAMVDTMRFIGVACGFEPLPEILPRQALHFLPKPPASAPKPT